MQTDKRVRMKSRIPGKCRNCGRSFGAGEWIVWKGTGNGAVHDNAECYERYTEFDSIQAQIRKAREARA